MCEWTYLCVFGVVRRMGLGLGLGIAWVGLKGLGIRESLHT